MVSVGALRDDRSDGDMFGLWRTGLRGARALQTWWADGWAVVAGERATLATLAHATALFCEQVDSIVYLSEEWTEFLLDGEWDDEEIERVGQGAAGAAEVTAVLGAAERWLSQPPLMVWGVSNDPTEHNTQQHGLLAVCWWPFRGTLINSWNGDLLKTLIGAPAAHRQWLDMVPPLARVPLDLLRAELNRRPVLGMANFGDVVVFALNQTGNLYADTHYEELQMGGGWIDGPDWQDVEWVRTIRAEQDQAIGWSKAFAMVAAQIHTQPDAMFDVALALYGAVAAVRAHEDGHMGRTLMDIVMTMEVDNETEAAAVYA